MNILFLTPFAPSKIAGGHNYTRQLLNDFAKNKFNVDLIYFKYSKDPEYKTTYDGIKVLKCLKISRFQKLWNVVKLPIFWPIFTVRFSWKLLLFIIKLNGEKRYDLIYLDHQQMFIYGLFLKKQRKILMAHDVMYQRYLRRYNPLIAKIVALSENFFLKQKNSIVCSFSEKDKIMIFSIYKRESIVVNFFLDDQIYNLNKNRVNTNEYVFFGKWGRKDNLDGLLWFFEEVYPKIDWDIKILIIGAELPKEVEVLLCKKRNVFYLGFIDNPYDIIGAAAALLAPVFSGAGVKVKVVESLACGTPVIGTKVSFEGISNDFLPFMIEFENENDLIEKLRINMISFKERIHFRNNFLEQYKRNSLIEQVWPKNNLIYSGLKI
jgi:glycosyltransferase involved in cell wall biosynthesis